MEESSKICDFYKNKSIFITGGTGFVGKIIVEKLLRSCPDLNKIYLLVRPKKGQSPQQRLENLANLPCFEPLKNARPDFLHQLVLIEGDVYKQSLGICEQDLQEVKKCEIVIHAAANVRFDQSLSEAANNVRAVVEIVAIAQTMPDLCSFIYVSTAYSHCIRKEIDEKFYPPPITAENLFNILDAFSLETIKKLTPSLLEPYPNTYVYTKAIAEEYVQRNAANLNCAIIRPSIVSSTLLEPIPGWIDNFYGVVGIVAGAALGVIRTLYGKLDSVAQCVPCDYVANHILAVTWAVAEANSNRNMQIYNFTGSNKNLLTWRRFVTGIESCAWDYPTEKQIWYYAFKIRENKTWNRICIFLLHTVLAYIADLVLFCIGRERIAVKNYTRLDQMLDTLSYFSSNKWLWHTDNVDNLWQKMTKRDQQLFYFNMDNLDWDQYAKVSVIGGRVYLLKDPLDTLPKGRKKLLFLAFIHYLSVAFFWFLVYKFCCFIYGCF